MQRKKLSKITVSVVNFRMAVFWKTVATLSNKLATYSVLGVTFLQKLMEGSQKVTLGAEPNPQE